MYGITCTFYTEVDEPLIWLQLPFGIRIFMFANLFKDVPLDSIELFEAQINLYQPYTQNDSKVTYTFLIVWSGYLY